MSNMKKYGAAPAEYAWAPIEIQQSDEVVNAVVPPQRLCPRPKRKRNGAVIELIPRIVAPSVRPLDRTAVGTENLPGVRAPQPAGDEELSQGRDAVALASFGRDPAPTNGALELVWPHAKHSAARAARQSRQRPDGDARMQDRPATLKYAKLLTKVH
jgi:hypothetical protein